MISWGLEVNDYGNAILDSDGKFIKVKGQGVTEDLWQEMVAYSDAKGLKKGDYKKLNLPFESKLLAQPKAIQQGYSVAEPIYIQEQGKFKPVVHLLADHGFSTYSTLIEARTETVKNNPDLVQRFVDASVIGWVNFMYGNRSAANALMMKDNPEVGILLTIADPNTSGGKPFLTLDSSAKSKLAPGPGISPMAKGMNIFMEASGLRDSMQVERLTGQAVNEIVKELKEKKLLKDD
jgi:hypothetical protein